MRLFSIGHGTRTSHALASALAAQGVRVLVDIRSYPASRHNPQFNRAALEQALPAEGIRYVHEPRLGGRRHGAGHLSPNAGWKNPHFRAYADHMGTPEFEAGLGALLALAAVETTAFMCAETLPTRCHRALVADALVARGHEVVHILDEQRTMAHRLTPFARLGPDGSVTYPRPERGLDEA